MGLIKTGIVLVAVMTAWSGEGLADDARRDSIRRGQVEQMVVMVNSIDTGLIYDANDSLIHLVMPRHALQRQLEIRFAQKPNVLVRGHVRAVLDSHDLAGVYVRRADLGEVEITPSAFRLVRRRPWQANDPSARALGHPNGSLWQWVDGARVIGTEHGEIHFAWGAGRPPVVRGFSGGVLVDADWNVAGYIISDDVTGVAYSGQRLTSALRNQGWRVSLRERVAGDPWVGRFRLGTAVFLTGAIVLNATLAGVNDELKSMPRGNRAEILTFNEKVRYGTKLETLRNTVGGVSVASAASWAWRVYRESQRQARLRRSGNTDAVN